VLVHWWYYPDSYDTWVDETSDHADPESPPINNGPWNVGDRWIIDSNKFNEWMNEEDYEISNDSGIENEFDKVPEEEGEKEVYKEMEEVEEEEEEDDYEEEEEEEDDDEDEFESVKSDESKEEDDDEKDVIIIEKGSNDDIVSEKLIKKDKRGIQEVNDVNDIVQYEDEDFNDKSNVMYIDNNYNNKKEESSLITEFTNTSQLKEHKLDYKIQKNNTIDKSEFIQPTSSSKRPRTKSPEPKTTFNNSKVSFINIEEEASRLDLPRQKRNELDPIMNGDIGNISSTIDNKIELMIYGKLILNIYYYYYYYYLLFFNY
jgi:hypothetical protein